MANFTVQDRQAVEALDHNLLTLALGGNAIKSGCGVSVNSGSLGASDTLSVDSGGVLVDGADVSVGSQSVGIDSPNDDPRKDVVYVDDSGSAVVAKGTAEPQDPPSAEWPDSFRPIPPSLSDAPGTPLAEVWVPSDSTAIDADNLRDRRIDTVTALSLVGDVSVSESDLTFDTATQTDLNDHAASGSAHHTRPTPGTNLTENSGAFDVVQGDGSGLNADSTDGYDIFVQSSAPSTSDPYIRFEP